MKDQELVNALREHAEWAQANEWETPITLGDDEYFVMGDNRPVSKDSRYVGPVKKSQIFAKKMLVLLPISDIGVKD